MNVSQGIKDVVLKVVRSAADDAERRRLRARSADPPSAPTTAYTAVVYADVPLMLQRPVPVPASCPAKVGDLELAGAGRLEIGWNSYEEYLAAFLQGEKTSEVMRYRLLRTLSRDLAAVIEHLSNRPTRLWFSSECPELDELPWELLLAEPGTQWETNLSFVRGMPPDPPRPLVPLRGKPRLAVIGSPPFAPPELWQRLKGLNNIEVVPLSAEPRSALQQASAEGFELVHLVADGYVNQAYESTLYFHGLSESVPGGPALGVSELSSHLLASQVALIGLTAPNYGNPDVMTLGGENVPSVYRAYARLGSASASLPTIVAPMGPLDGGEQRPTPRLAQFWAEFYEALGEGHDAEAAIRRARGLVRGAPMALFLRHSRGVLFRSAQGLSDDMAAGVAHKAAEYALSLRFAERLRSRQESLGGVSQSLNAFLDEEAAHQQRIATELEEWIGKEGAQ